LRGFGLGLRSRRHGPRPGLEGRRDRLQLQVAVLEAEADRAVQPSLHHDLVPGPNASGLLLRDLEASVAPAEREIGRDGALLRLGEEALEIGTLRQAAVPISGIGGLAGEALVPEGDEMLMEEDVRLSSVETPPTRSSFTSRS
jgi:hypothetical protein